MGSHSRVHYMHNLRAFAMLLGVFLHRDCDSGKMA